MANSSIGQQKNVEPAVIIVIEKCTTASDRFDEVLLEIHLSIYGRSPLAGLCGNLDEVSVERRARGFPPGCTSALRVAIPWPTQAEAAAPKNPARNNRRVVLFLLT
jgi:hypothetical protein